MMAGTNLTRDSIAAGFTLIEVLMVVALVAMLALEIGLALRRPDESVALQSAQASLGGLLNAARGRAAISQQNARLVISADLADSAHYLRFLQIVEQDAGDPATWHAQGDGILLPAGVFVIPPSPAGIPGNPSWPASRRSTALPSSPQSMLIDGAASGAWYYVQFTPRGTTAGGCLLITVGHFSAGASRPVPALDNSDNLRGLLLRSSGAITALNDASSVSP
jgi:prepilin-type N-terminal cleavage/methylation domain-containing protein